MFKKLLTAHVLPTTTTTTSVLVLDDVTAVGEERLRTCESLLSLPTPMHIVVPNPSEHIQAIGKSARYTTTMDAATNKQSKVIMYPGMLCDYFATHPNAQFHAAFLDFCGSLQTCKADLREFVAHHMYMGTSAATKTKTKTMEENEEEEEEEEKEEEKEEEEEEEEEKEKEKEKEKEEEMAVLLQFTVEANRSMAISCDAFTPHRRRAHIRHFVEHTLGSRRVLPMMFKPPVILKLEPDISGKMMICTVLFERITTIPQLWMRCDGSKGFKQKIPIYMPYRTWYHGEELKHVKIKEKQKQATHWVLGHITNIIRATSSGRMSSSSSSLYSDTTHCVEISWFESGGERTTHSLCIYAEGARSRLPSGLQKHIVLDYHEML